MSRRFARAGLFRGNLIVTPADMVAGTAHVKGVYTELVASLAADIHGFELRATAAVGTSGNATDMLMDIAVGAAASETVIVANIAVGYIPAGQQMFIPIHVPMGTRLSGRIQARISADTFSPRLNLWYAGGMPFWGGYTSAVTYGAATATSSATTISNTAGTWTQITASTTEFHRALTMLPSLPNNTTSSDQATHTVDVGMGAAASEVAIGSWIVETQSTEIVIYRTNVPWLGVNVPTGSRLSIRKDTTNPLGATLIGWS